MIVLQAGMRVCIIYFCQNVTNLMLLLLLLLLLFTPTVTFDMERTATSFIEELRDSTNLSVIIIKRFSILHNSVVRGKGKNT
jgi:hypothetical protein